MEQGDRPVHSARYLLEVYKQTKNLDIIRQATITRFDVALCVFQDEREAYRELQIKNLYNILPIEYKPVHEAEKRILAMLAITLLTNIAEFDSPLSLNDAVDIVLDILGQELLPTLQESAQGALESKQEIIAPYTNYDHEWINISKRVCECLEMIAHPNIS